MKTFELILHDMNREQRNDRVQSFVGTDASGSFGILAGHETCVTCLRPGLARFRDADDQWHYIAQSGAVLFFCADRLRLSATQFILSREPDSLLQYLDAQWRAAERDLAHAKRTVAQVEQALARKLWELSRRGVSL